MGKKYMAVNSIVPVAIEAGYETYGNFHEGTTIDIKLDGYGDKTDELFIANWRTYYVSTAVAS